MRKMTRTICLALLLFQIYVTSVVIRTDDDDDFAIASTDASAGNGGGNPNAPALTKVELKARVGVLLDEFPVSTRQDITDLILGKGNSWWRKRAEMQVDLTSYRLTYRSYYYDDKKYQLVLPDHSQWDFNFPEDAFNETRQGHKLVSRKYELTTYILSTQKDIKKSEPILADVGGVWIEEFTLPIDPFLLFQRTGFSCVDEGEYPPGTADPEKMEFMFDDTCEVENITNMIGPLGCNQCHCTLPLPTKSCVQALADNVGSISVQLKFTRINYDATLAAQYRTPTPNVEGADLSPSQADLTGTRVIYKYFNASACELGPDELCIGNFGWRRLLFFDAVDQNVGTLALDMQTKDFVKAGIKLTPPAPEIAYGLYEYSSCHKHYHFRHFGKFQVTGASSSTSSKRGFCVASVNRWANAEWSPTWSPFSQCANQGITAGWSDVYQAGISCQHIDITSVTPGTVTLSAESNFDGLLCEGTLKTWPNGTQKYELTTFTTLSGNPVSKQKCDLIPHYDDNNEQSVVVTIPPVSESYVTQTCLQTNQHFGPLRNCEFKKLTPVSRPCTAGSTKTLTCSFTLPSASSPKFQVLRVCESSIALGSTASGFVGTACRHQDALKNLIIENTGTVVQFQCPRARDSVEVGGQYSLYTAALRGENPATVTCT